MGQGTPERFTAHDDDLRIDLLVQPAVGYAAVSAGIPLVRRLTVTAVGAREVAGLRLTVELTSPAGLLAPPWTVVLDQPLQSGSSLGWDGLDGFAPSLAQLRDTDESFGVDFRVVAARSGGPSLRLVVPSLWLARNEWFNAPALCDSLAAFVQPNSGAVDTVLRSAAGILLNRTGSGALQGYHAGPERAVQTAAAVYASLRGLGIRAQGQTGGAFTHVAHRVRPTSAVLNRRAGTSVDLAVAYAACCLAAGLRPIIWLTGRHAIGGFLLEERTLGQRMVTDARTLLSMVDSGLAVPVDLTGIGAEGVDFTRAVEAGTALFGDTEILAAIDVRLAHRSGVTPIASDDRPPAEEMPTSVISPVLHGAHGDGGDLQLPNGAAAVRLRRYAEDGDDPAPTVPDGAPARVQRWKKSLLDLSLRNPLLNLPTTGRGVDLRVPAGTLATLDDLVHDGSPLRLVADGDTDPQTLARGLSERRRVHVAVGRQRYVAAMRALQREARTLQQETGGNYLYLTLGTLVHPKSGGGEAAAPLFLLPVRIEGGTGGSPYTLVIDGSELAAPNQCLVEWLRSRHGVRIPQLENPARDEIGIDLAKAVAAIAAGLVEHQLPYRVEETASLRLLQFASFQMWRDLTDHWPTFLRNPVVRHLVMAGGADFADPACPADPTGGPADAVDEAELHLPLPADGSQLHAVAMADRGRSFVLQGPPGTGKSQTITNLIARALAAGRTVLFVAEKEAALDVVKRRLAGIGLDPFVLNLHGRRQSMNAVRQQLLDALAQSDPGDEAGWAAAEAGLRAAIAPLAAYPDRVHRPASAGLSVWSAYEALLAGDDDPTDGRVDGPVATVPQSYLDEPEDRRTQVELALRQLPMAARSAGLGPDHPWSCSGRRTVAGMDAATLTATAADLEALRGRIADRSAVVSLLRGTASPFELAGMLPAIRLAARGALVGRAPTQGVATTRRESGTRFEPSSQWENAAGALEADLRMFHEAYTAELHAFRTDVYDRAPLDSWQEEADDAATRMFGRAKRLQTVADRLTPYLAVPAPLDPERVPHLIARLLAIRSLEATFHQRVRGLDGLVLPPSWRAIAPDAVALFAEARTASAISGTLQAQHPAAWDALDHGLAGDDADLLERVANAWTGWSRQLQIGELEFDRWCGGDHWFFAWQRSGAAWLSDLREQALRGIQRWAVLLTQASPLLEAGLVDLHRSLLSGQLPMPEAEPAYRRGVAKAALDACLRASGLEYFDPDTHEAHVTGYARATDELRTALLTRLPSILVRRRGFTAETCRGRVADVVGQLRRRRGGASLRELFAGAADVILALTPCVLVSPASAATFLPPDAATFDLVVFDEASQIRLAEAIGVMGRGRATVIVGDSQQMPPTAVLRPTVDPELDELFDDAGELPEDFDSLLGEAVEARLPQYWLSWHYRSHDEALIAYSNRHFYQDRLSSLPSPDPAVGSSITWYRVDGAFDRGASRTNAVEARAVVAEVARRLADPATAGDSIGIVTFNIQQRDLVLNLLEESTDPSIRARMSTGGDEPIFVKNLENVQGDERDVILFSLAYSTNPTTGRLPLAFGPLSQQGGERRLNVAITRARREVALFASFDPADIDLTRTTALGPRRLREYCELAADPPRRLAELVAGRNAQRSTERYLVRDEIAAAVRARGHEVRVGLGLSAFTVDLAVRTAGAPTWQVAVVLDGPQWSRRPTVADRDLAPALLTSVVGWPSVLRCWLPGWIADRRAFLDRLDAELARAGEPPVIS